MSRKKPTDTEQSVNADIKARTTEPPRRIQRGETQDADVSILSEEPEPAPVTSEIPRYQVLERCYINDTMFDPTTRPWDEDTDERKPLYITYSGIPGPHLKPANDAARAMTELHAARMQNVNPLNKLTQVTPDGKEI
jgi:hypothetical protein